MTRILTGVAEVFSATCLTFAVTVVLGITLMGWPT